MGGYDVDSIMAYGDEQRAKAAEAEIAERLKRAYGTALHHSHEGGNVQLHVADDVVRYIRSLAVVEDDRVLASRWFGFPLIPIDHDDPTHISVHVVHHVH